MAKVRVRDTVTGEFVDKTQAKKRPATTVSEKIKRKVGKKKAKKR